MTMGITWMHAYRVSSHARSLTAPTRTISHSCIYDLFAAQRCHLVPIVEPELLINGDHTMEKFASESERVILCCIQHLRQREVCLEACLLKLQMIIPGVDRKAPKPSSEQIGQQTFDLMQR